ncbi:MAG: hypothetical protein ACRD5Z_20670, partial [Bryobacteraceae bacterium]
GGLLGLIVGYYIGATVACDWLIPTSNLCGIYGVFLTGPIGFLVGIICGWKIARRGQNHGEP